MGEGLQAVSGGVLVAVAILAAVQLGLLVWSLVDLTRRPRVTGGRKWVWVLVVFVGGLIGPLLYLALGRQQEVREEPGGAAPGVSPDRAQRAADVLYGKKGGA